MGKLNSLPVGLRSQIIGQLSPGSAAKGRTSPERQSPSFHPPLLPPHPSGNLLLPPSAPEARPEESVRRSPTAKKSFAFDEVPNTKLASSSSLSRTQANAMPQPHQSSAPGSQNSTPAVLLPLVAEQNSPGIYSSPPRASPPRASALQPSASGKFRARRNLFSIEASDVSSVSRSASSQQDLDYMAVTDPPSTESTSPPRPLPHGAGGLYSEGVALDRASASNHSRSPFSSSRARSIGAGDGLLELLALEVTAGGEDVPAGDRLLERLATDFIDERKEEGAEVAPLLALEPVFDTLLAPGSVVAPLPVSACDIRKPHHCSSPISGKVHCSA